MTLQLKITLKTHSKTVRQAKIGLLILSGDTLILCCDHLSPLLSLEQEALINHKWSCFIHFCGGRFFLGGGNLIFAQCYIIETENSAMRRREANQTVESLPSFQVRPIPTMTAPKTACKNRKQKAEVLMSTPVKNQQANKIQNINTKKTKIAEIAGSSCSRVEIKRAKRGIKSAKDEKDTQCFCLVCSEQYTDPPFEDWI